MTRAHWYAAMELAQERVQEARAEVCHLAEMFLMGLARPSELRDALQEVARRRREWHALGAPPPVTASQEDAS